LARPMSVWVHTTEKASQLAADGVDALVAAATPPGGPATLIIPQDTCWTDVDDVPSPVAEVPPRALTSPTEIDAVAAALREAGRSAVVVLGTTGLRGDALIAASRVAAATGCRVM